MRRICLPLLAFAAFTLHAGVIRGTVAENSTGNSLAGALVALQPIGSAAAAASSVRAGESGNFEFGSLPAGAYIVRASKRGFLPLEYGQRQWNSAGTAVRVTEEGAVFLNIRLHRPGTVTGLVRDENDVGMAGHEVIAYRNTEPPQIANRAKSDDRGVYRISGLEPGTYLIRTAGNLSSDASYIPTFSKQTLRVEDAQQVQVYPDEDAKSIDVRPEEGKLFRLTGAAAPVGDGYKISITLSSDMGRRTSTSPNFDWSGLPPGPYEIYAEAIPQTAGLPAKGGWTQFNLNRDMRDFNLSMVELRDTQFDFIPRQTSRSNSVAVIARRRDLAGTSDPQLLKIADGRATIAPGRWEMIAVPPDGSYISQFSPSANRSRPDGWNEVTVHYGAYVRIAVSGAASSVHGTVKVGGEPVEAAPVFLEPWDPDARKRVVELRSVRADAGGSYVFNGLAPGTYRLMSSFEYLTPDPTSIDLTSPHVIRIEPRTDQTIDLDLYGAR